MYGNNQYNQHGDLENPMMGGQYQQMQDNPQGKHKKNKNHHHNDRKSSSSSSSSDSKNEPQGMEYFNSNSDLGSDKFLRSGFVSKVYSILTVQMIVTVLFCATSMSSESFRLFQLNNFGLLLATMIGSIICMLVLICSRDQARKVPNNYIILGIFTICESYLVGFVCGFSNPRIVFMAAFFTLAVFFSLTLYACTTKSDFTMMGGTLAMLGMSLLIFSLFVMFTDNKVVHIIYSSLAAIMFGFYILYDTQLIIGTKSFKYSIDDYIIASLELYSDIIGLFLQILSLLQNLSSSD